MHGPTTGRRKDAMKHILDSRLVMTLGDVSFAGWGIWRVGWSSRVNPPIKRGRWWLWVGPYLVGRPDDTW